MALPPIANQNEPSILSQYAPAIASFGLPALLTLLLTRRIRAGGPVPEQLAKAIREKGLLRHVPDEDIHRNRLGNLLQHGTADVIGEPAGKTVTDKVLLAPISDTPRTIRSRTGTIGAGGAKYRGSPKLIDKAFEGELFTRAGASEYPGVIRGSRIPVKLRQIKDPDQRFRAIQRWLDRRFGGQWIIKGTDEAQTAGRLLTEESDLAKIYRRARNRKLDTRMALKLSLWDKLRGMPKYTTLRKLRNLPQDQRDLLLQRLPSLHGEGHLKTLMKSPGAVMVQHRVNLQRMNPIERALARVTTGAPPTKEFRVHALGDKVIPLTSGSRYGLLSRLGEGAMGFAGRTPANVRKTERAVEQALQKVKRIDPDYVKNRMFAFDVGLTPSGRPKIIEANPEGFSGFLAPSTQLGGLPDPMAALHSHRLISALQRRTTLPLALAQSAAAGGIGYGALAGARKIKESLES